VVKQFLESLVIFAIVLGAWVVFAFLVVTLASLFREGEIAAFAAGGTSILGLLVAVGVAARLVGRRFGRLDNPHPMTQ
jgi:hypothetical protein